MVLVVGITGSSDVIYGIRLLEVLSSTKGVETHLVISEAGEANIKYETDWEMKDVTLWRASPTISTKSGLGLPAAHSKEMA